MIIVSELICEESFHIYVYIPNGGVCNVNSRFAITAIVEPINVDNVPNILQQVVNTWRPKTELHDALKFIHV